MTSELPRMQKSLRETSAGVYRNGNISQRTGDLFRGVKGSGRTEAAHEALSVNGSFPRPVINIVNRSKPQPWAPMSKMTHVSPGQGVKLSFAMTAPLNALILHNPSSS